MMMKADAGQTLVTTQPIWSTSYLNYLSWAGNQYAAARGKTSLTRAIRQTAQALTLTQVSVSGTAVTYTGTITGGGANAYAGWAFAMTGFTNASNNGTFIVTASTATTLVVTLVAQVNETHAGTATSASTTTAYLGSFPDGVSNFLAGKQFVISDFPTNNGNNLDATAVISSDVTAIAMTNAGGVNETNTASAWPFASSTYRLTQAIRQTAQSFTLTSISGTNTFNGTITGGAANAYAGWVFLISGFVNGVNNGYFTITASTATTLVIGANILTNETTAANAASSSNTTAYLGTITGGACSATQPQGGFADCGVVVANFPTNPGNNGTWKVLSSSATAFGVTNSGGVNETPGSNARGIAAFMNGMSYVLNQTGYTNTTDPGQCVWQTVGFLGTVTNADGTIGNRTVRYTLSVTPSGIRVGQIFTVTNTTSNTFDLSGQITAINTGAKTVDVQMNSTPSNTSQSGLTASGWVLANTLSPGPSPVSNSWLYNASPPSFVAPSTTVSHHFPTKFQGVWSASAAYQTWSSGIARNGVQYPPHNFNDVVWNSATDPNHYVCVARSGWNVISATGNNVTITYTLGTSGAPGSQPFALSVSHGFVANEHITVTGCTTSTLNVVNALITSVTTSTVTVTVAGFNTTEKEPSAALMVVLPGVTGNATQDTATLTHWVPFSYEIFQSNDGFTTYYMKVEYGQASAGSLALTVQYGTGTDGFGGLSGNLSYREPLGNTGSSSNTTLHEWFFFGEGSGSSLMCVGPKDANVSVQGNIWIVERSRNASGTRTNSYITYIHGYGSQSSAGNWKQNSLFLSAGVHNNIVAPQVLLYPGQTTVNTAVVNQGVFALGISSLASLSWRFGRAGTAGSPNIAVSPVFPNVGYLDNPLTMIVATVRSTTQTQDTQDDGVFAMSMYGTSHNYLMLDTSVALFTTFPSGTTTNRAVLMFRWDA